MPRTGRPYRKDGSWSMGRRSASEDAEAGSAVQVGQGGPVGRSRHRTREPAMQGRSPHAHLPEGQRDLPDTWECGSASHRGARCEKTARRDLCGGRRVTGVPTAMVPPC